ncbi:MAG TPA: SIS domain-containing protein [Trebonia sp.]|nr:SIS domain-containing protein [Trebonia sp.]
MTERQDNSVAAAMESLYPFLYADGAHNEQAVLAQVRASTINKAEEILELRRMIARQDGARIARCAREMAARFAAGGRLFAFGNGGSATDAAQLATLFLHPGPLDPGSLHLGSPHPGAPRPAPRHDGTVRPLPALGLASDPSVVTALCNDIGIEVVFARQLGAFAQRGDIAVGLSTSGNSGNLLRAFDEASQRGMLTVGLAGYEGGKMAELDSLDYLFVVRSDSVHRIQEAQTTIYQVLWELTARELTVMGVSHVPRDTR